MAKSKRKPRKDASTGSPSEPVPESAAAGQSGDLQGLSGVPTADSESVRELLEEGQAYEASVISGIENAPEPDVAEVKTHEVPEDDVPLEYLQQEQERPKE